MILLDVVNEAIGQDDLKHCLTQYTKLSNGVPAFFSSSSSISCRASLFASSTDGAFSAALWPSSSLIFPWQAIHVYQSSGSLHNAYRRYKNKHLHCAHCKALLLLFQYVRSFHLQYKGLACVTEASLLPFRMVASPASLLLEPQTPRSSVPAELVPPPVPG